MNSTICTLKFGLGTKGGLDVREHLTCIVCVVSVAWGICIFKGSKCMVIAMRVWCSQMCGL